MFNKINNYLEDNEFKFTVYEDKLHIINFQKIISLEDEYISILNKNNKITFQGTNYKLKKLLEDEMLVKGNITKIEVSNVK